MRMTHEVLMASSLTLLSLWERETEKRRDKTRQNPFFLLNKNSFLLDFRQDLHILLPAFVFLPRLSLKSTSSSAVSFTVTRLFLLVCWWSCKTNFKQDQHAFWFGWSSQCPFLPQLKARCQIQRHASQHRRSRLFHQQNHRIESYFRKRIDGRRHGRTCSYYSHS